jgi:guanylate kinase
MAESPRIDNLLVIVGLTGVGKSKLIEKLLKDFPGHFAFPKTLTTDPNEDPRNCLIVGKDKFLDV